MTEVARPAGNKYYKLLCHLLTPEMELVEIFVTRPDPVYRPADRRDRRKLTALDRQKLQHLDQTLPRQTAYTTVPYDIN